MSILIWILLGSFIGILAHLLDHQEAQGGLVGAIITGALGALFGGWTASSVLGTSGKDLSTLLIVFSSGLFLLLIQHTLLSRSEKF